MTIPVKAEQGSGTGGADDLDLRFSGMNAAEQFVGGLLDSLPDDEEGDETPPDSSADPEPKPDAGPGEKPPVDRGQTPPDEGDDDLEEGEPVDPLAQYAKDAKPLPYKVNQQERAFEHILWQGEGKPAIIPADKVREVQNAIARSDSNAEANRDLYEQKQRWERAGGFDKLHAALDESAELNAATLVLLDAVTKNPLKLVRLDENGDVVPNEEFIGFLLSQAGVASERARYAARDARQKAEQTFAKTSTDAEVRAAAIPHAVETHFKHYNLPPEDYQAAIDIFQDARDAYLFNATPEQAAQFGLQPGQLMVDLPKMDKWFRDRAALRANLAAQQEARKKAEEENAERVPAAPLPRRRDGTFRRPTRGERVAMRKMSKTELDRAIRRGDDIPEDGMVPDNGTDE